jgi:predicted GNAT family N-acyltransferase
MFHSVPGTATLALSPQQGAGTIAFSDAFHRIVSKSSVRSADIQMATRDETLRALNLARALLPVASDAVVSAVYTHNPECFRIVRREPFASSFMMAYLPLNGAGAAALVDGRFDAASPSLRHICRRGERPTVIYSWLTYVPRNMIAGLRLVRELETIGGGTAIFTRPAHPEALRILSMAGFIPARDIFPSAPESLLVALMDGESESLGSGKSSMTVRVVRNFEDMSKIILIRSATYMTEQLCTFDEEFDGNDFCATHLIGEVNGEPAGCVRIRYFGGFAKLERLAVRPEFRRSRLMWRLVKAAFDHCACKGFTKLYAHAREDLVPAWERFGARLMEGREPFYFSDVRFREMELDLPQHPRTIRFGADPMLLIRPEGEWDALGPLDCAQLIHNPQRRSRVEEVRRLEVG